MDLDTLRDGPCRKFSSKFCEVTEVFEQLKFPEQSLVSNNTKFSREFKKKMSISREAHFRESNISPRSVAEATSDWKVSSKNFLVSFRFVPPSYIDRTNGRLIYFAHDEYVMHAFTYVANRCLRILQ
jgi:hypothetical protein